jgi:hypothetical protein
VLTGIATMRRLAAVAVALAVNAGGTPLASGEQSVRMSARLDPERPGAPTVLTFRLRVLSDAGSVPAPLTAVNVHYPSSLGFATSGLGLATCPPLTLEALGPQACPANSRMGSGSALARFQIGPEIFEESADLAVLAGPSPDGYVRPLISAEGGTPVSTQIVMPSVLSPGQLKVTVPLVPGLPEGPDVAVVAVSLTLGGELTYRETVHGHTRAYRPRGITLPARCPPGGFGFAADLMFLDSSAAHAETGVPCPRAAHTRR